MQFIDTADVYGPGDNERIIREALFPYPPDLVIGTKVGLVRNGPATRENPGLSMNGGEAHSRRTVERSLTLLGVERIDCISCTAVDRAIPIEESMRVFRALTDEGKIRHVGLSEVSVDEIRRAQTVVEIATVQNIYNLANRAHTDVLEYCERNGIGFIPFWPLHGGVFASSPAMAEIVSRTRSTPAKVALAWLLGKSPAIIVIPGTSSLEHLEENVSAYDLRLNAADMTRLDALTMGPA